MKTKQEQNVISLHRSMLIAVEKDSSVRFWDLQQDERKYQQKLLKRLNLK